MPFGHDIYHILSIVDISSCGVIHQPGTFPSGAGIAGVPIEYGHAIGACSFAYIFQVVFAECFRTVVVAVYAPHFSYVYGNPFFYVSGS